MRAFTSHQFNLGLSPGSGVISELNLFGSRPLLERAFFFYYLILMFFTRFDRVFRFHSLPVLKMPSNYNSIRIGRGRITLWMYYSSTIKSLYLLFCFTPRFWARKARDCQPPLITAKFYATVFACLIIKSEAFSF